MSSKELEDALKALRELKRYVENAEREDIKETKPFSSLPYDKQKLLKELFAETCEKLEKFFKVRGFSSLVEEIENLVEIYVPQYESFEIEHPAHFDPKYGKIRLSSKFFERYEKDPQRVKFTLAEEITHCVRDRLIKTYGKNKLPEVEELFGHLAKLALGYEPGIGKKLLEEYQLQKEGKWYTIEELDERLEKLKDKVKNTISEPGKIKSIDELKKQTSLLLAELNVIKENIPLGLRKHLEIEVVRPLINKYKLIVLLEKEGRLNQEYLSYIRDSLIKSFDRFREEVRKSKDTFIPYKKRLLLPLSQEYIEWKNLEAHAKGYSTAEEIFKYIKEGKIDPRELFYKNPESLKKYLLGGSAADYLKRLGYKVYAEYKSKLKGLKKYLKKFYLFFIVSALLIPFLHFSSSQAALVLFQPTNNSFLLFSIIIALCFILFYYFIRKNINHKKSV